MAAADNARVVRRIFDAFAARDALSLRDVFADDAVWTVPGDGVMAGTFSGPHEILRFLGRLPRETDGTYRSELIDVLASEGRAAAFYRARGERSGRTLDIEQLLLFEISGGLVTRVTALPCDPVAFESFWA
ncbi:MAG: nuclear transport factor 2 family protein [Gaiella sp.]